MQHISQSVSVILKKIRLNILKMNSILVVVVGFFLGYVSTKESDVVLKATSEQAINGKPYTLSCKMDPSLNTTGIIWYRKGTAVFMSGPYGKTEMQDVNKTQIGDVTGRFFINMHGFFQHHLTLFIDSRKDDTSSWRCKAAGTEKESNMLIIHTIEPEAPSACGIKCIFGAATGVTVGALILDLLICSRGFKRI